MATDTATPTQEATADKPKRKINGVYVSTPEVLRAKLEEEAAKSETSVAGMVRKMLADRYGLELPAVESPIRRKYATKDEAKLAQVKARKSRQEVIKALMEAHKARMAGDLEKANQLEARATGIQSGEIEVEVPAVAPKAAAEAEGGAPTEGAETAEAAA